MPEPLFHVRRVALPLGTEWRKRPAFIPRVIEIGKGTTPNIKDKKHWRWWKNASEGNHAGHSIRRGPDVHWTTSRFPRLSDKLNPIHEWSRFKWPFRLEHSWPDAPPGFRRQFLFIWRDRFDSRPKNPISKDRSDSPSPHETDFFQGRHLSNFRASGSSSLAKDDLVQLVKFTELAVNYRLFAIPRTIHTKREANAMGAWLAKELKIGLPNDREMLGTFQEWRDWLSVDKKETPAVQKETHFYRRRSYMTGLADQIYPHFNVETLLAPPKHRARGRQYVPKGRQS